MLRSSAPSTTERHMLRKLLGVTLAAFTFALVACESDSVPTAIEDPDRGLTTAGHAPDYFNGFETDLSGWFNQSTGTITREMSGYSNAGGYADGIASASGDWHARLRPTDHDGSQCTSTTSDAFACSGPFTDWGDDFDDSGFPTNGYVTEVDIYLDVEWAGDHPDVRFDWSSAINESDGAHLRDFVFNAGTDPTGQDQFVVSASTNATRGDAFPSNPDKEPQFITQSGWYTFRHTFTDDGGTLQVDMEILDSNGTVVASWVRGGDDMSNVGGNRYGWFVNQEILDLPIDNSARRSIVLDPQSKDDCKDGGWMEFGFEDQGQCIRFVNTGKDSR